MNEERDMDKYISDTGIDLSGYYTYRRSGSRRNYYKERRGMWRYDSAIGDEDGTWTWTRKNKRDVALGIHMIQDQDERRNTKD